MGVKISELTEAMAAQNTDELPIVQNGETKKINVETLMSNIQTQITNLQNQVNDKNIISATGTSSATASSTGDFSIPITQAIEQIGDKFTISTNRIYVGSGVSKVLVSGQVYFNLAANRGGALNLYIRKNGSSINGQTNGGYASTSTRNACLSLPPKLISVSQGDYFDWIAYLYNGDVIRTDSSTNTFLTIEVID